MKSFSFLYATQWSIANNLEVIKDARVDLEDSTITFDHAGLPIQLQLDKYEEILGIPNIIGRNHLAAQLLGQRCLDDNMALVRAILEVESRNSITTHSFKRGLVSWYTKESKTKYMQVAEDYTYEQLIAADCLTSGYKIVEYPGDGFVITPPSGVQRITNGTQCSCSEYEKRRACAHTSLATIAKANRSHWFRNNFLEIK